MEAWILAPIIVVALVFVWIIVWSIVWYKSSKSKNRGLVLVSSFCALGVIGIIIGFFQVMSWDDQHKGTRDKDSLDLERQKFELEKEKFELEKQKHEKDKSKKK